MQNAFLSAEWRHLVMINYEIDPTVLQPYVPKGTELDFWNGKAFMSLVGFMFLDTKIWGIKIPFHVDFEEVNLRFYVKRKHPEGDRRGVVFIREIVPKKAIAFLARFLYNEPYIALPMHHKIEHHLDDIHVQFSWEYEGAWQRLGVRSKGEPKIPEKGSLTEFIAEHYWGYTRQRSGKTIEYRVEHPQWRAWDVIAENIHIDFEKLYGPDVAPFLARPYASAFLAEGSKVNVFKGIML